MKKILSVILTLVFIFAFSACGDQTAGNEAKITSDEALTIALEKAGVTRESITNLENTLDTENGQLVYEIDFDSGNTEYSFDVNAETGEIVERDRDIAD